MIKIDALLNKTEYNTVENLLEVVRNKDIIIDLLKEENRLLKYGKFGTSSEKVCDTQISLFNEAEVTADVSIVEPAFENVIIKHKVKQKGNREELFKDLPVEIIEHKLSDEELYCEKCEGILHEMGFDIHREIKVIPAKYIIEEHHYYKYACRQCEEIGTSSSILVSPKNESVLPGSYVSPSLMAEVMCNKFVLSLPLYRQEAHYKSIGLDFSRQTLANWVIKGSQLWLSKIYNLLHSCILESDIIHADETTLQVLHEDDRKAKTKSYIWLYRSGRGAPEIALYEYQTTRASKHPRAFLEGFSGVMHVDGYAGYHDIPGVKLACCWAHARRKFVEALKALPKELQKDSPENIGFNYCNQLFAIERELKNASSKERFEGRLKKSKPVLEAFLVWLNSQNAIPKSALYKAIFYCKNQWQKLNVFLEDGRLEIDNNRAERSIKPFVIGRKNWLFANSTKGAESSAVIYSIIETAKANGLIPFVYLTFLFEKLPNLKDESELLQLLPWSDTLPDYCKLPTRNTIS